MSDDIIVMDNFLPTSVFEDLSRFISMEPLTYGSRSNFRTDPHGHWSRNFAAGDRFNLADVASDLEKNQEAASVHSAWKFLRETCLPSNILIRCYVNGYTYGTDGYFHADSERPDEHTSIVYLNDYWEPDWAGETVFLGKDGDIIKAVLPKGNRAVIFPAAIQHAGRSVSRKCMVLRQTLIFKSRKGRSGNFEKLSAFLQNVGARKHSHKSGTLHDHLVRTFSILEMKGFDSTVCFGGGLHAIYGTNSFGHSLLAASAKAQIADEFGPRAEELARLFSQLERPKTLDTPQDLHAESAVVELRDGQRLTLDRKSFDDLRKIECANLMDQNALGKHSALSKFWKAY
jgi:SM-20-related protein